MWSISVPAPVLATTAIKRSFPQLVQRADVIVVGTVTDIRDHWDAVNGMPFTHVTLADLTVLKGDPGPELTLEFFGGPTPDGRLIKIAGTPQFTLGEKVVLFCAGNHRDVIPLVGLWQGLLRVRIDPVRDEETVSDHSYTPIVGLRDGVFVTPPGGRALLSPDASLPEALSLDRLKELIEDELVIP